MNVFAIESEDTLDQRSNVHLFIVRRDNNRDRPAKRFVRKKRNVRQLFPEGRLLRMDED